MTRKRILLVGGAGVFGSRLARGLADTVDADVLIAGRSLAKAQAIAREVKRPAQLRWIAARRLPPIFAPCRLTW